MSLSLCHLPTLVFAVFPRHHCLFVTYISLSFLYVFPIESSLSWSPRIPFIYQLHLSLFILPLLLFRTVYNIFLFVSHSVSFFHLRFIELQSTASNLSTSSFNTVFNFCINQYLNWNKSSRFRSSEIDSSFILFFVFVFFFSCSVNPIWIFPL